MKRLLSVFLSVVLACGSIAAVCAAEQTGEVIIFHTNDTHGYVSGSDSVVGLAAAAALREQTPNSLLVDAGDATQGLPVASLSKGADIIELMNIAGYDIMAAGNHEFDFGKDNFLANVKRAKFLVLAANVYEGDAPFLANAQEGNNGCHTIIEKNGVRVGFFGLTTTQTKTSSNPAGTTGIEFKDEVATAKKEIDELKAEGADAIIAICHMGNGDAPCTSLDLANAMTGEYEGELDAIIDGHSHTVENSETNGVLIAQTGYGMSALGKMTLELKDGEVSVSEEQFKAADLANIEPKAEAVKKLEEITAAQEGMLAEIVGIAPTTLWAGWIDEIAPTRLVETNYGDLAADSYKQAAEEMLGSNVPVVAVENGGGIREAVYNGNITVGDLTSTFPFSNTLYIKEITPKLLYDIMEASAANLNGQDADTGMLLQEKIDGSFLQISGFSCVFDPTATDKRVTAITLDGQLHPLDRADETTKLVLVGNNYIMSGGGSYPMLADIPKLAEVGGELETVQSYIESRLVDGVLQGYSRAAGRISFIGNGYIPKDYTAAVKITDGEQAAANTQVSVIVDGSQVMSGTTDAEGYLRLTLEDGAHGVRIGSGKEVYVDNYAGFGLVEDQYRSYPQLKLSTEQATTEVTTEAATSASASHGSGAGASKNKTAQATTQSAVVSAEDITEGTTAVFNDIASHWCSEAVARAAENGLAAGYADGSFKPDRAVTRAEMVCFLARLSGDKIIGGSAGFTDVSDKAYYAGALAWAEYNGIVSGYADGSFKPSLNITREQAALMLYNYTRYKNIDTNSMDISAYSDGAIVSSWATEAVRACAGSGILTGRTENTLNPLDTLTRAEAIQAISTIE